MRTVQVKGQTVQFPDSFTDEQIDAIIQRDFFSDVRGAIAARAENPPPAATGDPREKSLLERGTELINPVNIATGQLKGAASTAYNVGKGIVNVAQGRPADLPRNPNFEAALQGQNAGESLGKGTEQVAEFMAPSLSAPLRAASAAGLAPRMAIEGANAATVATAQGGNPIAAGVVGAAVPGALALGQNLAPRMINSLLGAKKTQFLSGANPGRGVSDEGIMAGSLESLYKKIGTSVDAMGKRIGQILDTPAAQSIKVDITDGINAPIDKAIKAVQATGATGVVGRLEELRAGVTDALTNTGGTLGAATPKQLFEVKKLLDESIKHTSTEGAGASLREVVRSVRRNLAKAIGEGFKPIKPLNQRYADLSEAADAAYERLAASQGIQTFARNPWNYLAGTLGFTAGGPSGSLAALGTKEALTSTPVVTAGAQAVRAISSPAAQVGAGRLGAAMTDEDRQSVAREILRRKGQ